MFPYVQKKERGTDVQQLLVGGGGRELPCMYKGRYRNPFKELLACMFHTKGPSIEKDEIIVTLLTFF